ncbi:unnamed protein product [Adineta ricciae]|uniref:Uncharacterized protein n=1 Tax=Adineta ricciae TaxID=249248 RepID=A0A815J6X4_ADIRI|nr:unnamed protein product [Adineta ricciae]
MSDDFDFRVVLIKIQNSLSDSDRKQLHFLFGEDIPRTVQEDGSVSSSIDAFQRLLDGAKISPTDSGYLIRALRGINREDCVKRLSEYDKLISKVNQTEQDRNEASTISQPSQSNHPTSAEIMREIEDVDGGTATLPSQIETQSAPSIPFESPVAEPMDFQSIDLKPFEDHACEWTEDYSKVLGLKQHPRSYQIEIIRDAIRHKNTIVCLRTGAGKTFIASVLIKYYFIKKQKEQPNSNFSALFFVPRKAIRLQQAKAVSEIGNLRVQLCQDDQTIDQLIDTHHVIVATPKKFGNCLSKGTVRLAQLDLLIFDECHNTSGGNPYCEIMQYYLCPMKQQSTSPIPLIIGLTATVSAKDANEKKEPIDKNLVSICSKMASLSISTVCDPANIEEMNREISRPKNDQFECVQKFQYDAYFNEYSKMYKGLVEQIKQHLDNGESLDEHEIGSPSFIGQLVLLKRWFEMKGDVNNTIICDYLLLLTKKYSALRDLPFDGVVNS